MSLFDELKRRNVIRVAIAYIVTAWLLLQVSDLILDNFEAPTWVFKVFMLALAIGLPLAVLFAWAFELTPEGLQKEEHVDRSASITGTTGRKLDRIIMAVLVMALGYFVIDKFLIDADMPAEESAAAVTTAGISERSIAVLPFVNMSSDPEQDYFSDGISEELLSVLAQFQNLRVAARTSSFQFKGENQDIGKIAKQLKVAHVLEGSVRKSGTRLRISAQLIKASDGYNLWSETYDRELDDIFTIQDEIAAAIGSALEAELGLDANAADGELPTVIPAANTEAYEAFLQGRHLIHLRGRESLEEAVGHLERSLRLDANYAPAHAQLAIAIALLLDAAGGYGDLSMQEVTRRATPHINMAFELAPDLPEAHAARALMATNSGDWQLAVSAARKALYSNPSYTDAMNWQRFALFKLGRYREADELLEEILEIDPLSVIARMNFASVLQFRNELPGAHAVADELLAQSPWASYCKHAQASLFEGKVADSIEWGLKAYAEDPNDLSSNFTLVDGFIHIAEYAEARRVSYGLTAFADLAAGKNDDAVRQITARQNADSENLTLIVAAANIAHSARQFDVALKFLEELARRQPAGRPIGSGVLDTILLAWNRRHAGDAKGAEQAAQVVRNEIVALVDAGMAGRFLHTTEAMLAAYDGKTQEAIQHIDRAVALGQLSRLFFSNVLFDDIRDNPKFIALESKSLQALETERAKALQTICFNNPASSAWRPLPETCAGVEKTVRL